MVTKDSSGPNGALQKVDVKAAREALKKLKKKFEADCKAYRAAILKAKLKEVESQSE